MHASPPAFQHTGTEYESAFQQPLGEAMASGGWQSMLAAMGADSKPLLGAIVGKALDDGSLTIDDALAAAQSE